MDNLKACGVPTLSQAEALRKIDALGTDSFMTPCERSPLLWSGFYVRELSPDGLDMVVRLTDLGEALAHPKADL